MIKILTIVGLNVAFFWRTIWYGYSVDDWENARCGCKNPDITKVNAVNFGNLIPPMTIELCKRCGIKKAQKPRNFLEFALWSYGGLIKSKHPDGTTTTTQYTKPKFDHAFTLVMHIINCILVYLAFGKTDISFLAALLFAIHPAAMQGSSVWLSGKGYSAGLMFVLLGWWIKPLFPLFYGIGSFYVAVLVAPLMFLKTHYWYWLLLLPFGFILRKKMLVSGIKFKYSMVKKTRDPFHWHNIILVFKTIGYYFMLSIWPTRLGVHHEFMAMYGVTKQETKDCLKFTEPFFWIGVAITTLTGYMFFWHWNPIALGLMWFIVFIAPWSNWMAAVHQPIGERYGVISLVGINFVLANIIIDYPLVCIFFLTYYATITNQFLPAYRNILDFAVYNVLNFPRSFQGWLWKSDVERNFMLLERSFDSAMRAWIQRPHDFLVNNNVATLLLMQHRFRDAEDFLNRMAKAEMQNEEMTKKRDEKVAAMRHQISLDVAAIRNQVMKEQQFYSTLPTQATTLQNIPIQATTPQVSAKPVSVKPEQQAIAKVSRNAPCPCGSGKKYKRCHGKGAK